MSRTVRRGGAFARAINVRAGEGRSAALMTALMLVTLAGITVGESGVNALFLERVGADHLPTIYLAQGATGLVAMLVLTGALARVDRRRAYVALPIVLATVVLVERSILTAHPGWIYAVLWLTVAVAWLLQAVFLWGAAGLVTDTRQAKRLFPLFGAGGILGAVLGGLATRPLASVLGTENLLFVWAGSFLGSAALCVVLLGRQRRARASRTKRAHTHGLRDLTAGFGYVRSSSLLRWMTVASVLFSLLFFALYLPFAQAASTRYTDPAELAGFFGTFGAIVTAFAFVVSVALANRLLGWFGAAAIMLILAVLYAGSFGALLVASSFALLVVARGSVGMWLQGVTSPAWETLVNVVPEGRRDQVRTFLNGGPTQVGTLIAGVVALVGQAALSPRQLSMIGLAVAIGTIVTAWRVRRSYASALLDALRAGRPSVFAAGPAQGPPIVLERDAQALELAVEASTDPNPRIRRLAVDLLGPADDDSVAKRTLLQMVSDPDATVRMLAVEGLGRSGSIGDAALDQALHDADAGVRLAAIEAVRTASGSLDGGGALMTDPDPAVAAAACVALLAGGSTPEAEDALRMLVEARDSDVRLAVARELRSGGGSGTLDRFIQPLLEDRSNAVRAEALRTLGVTAPTAAIPRAIDALGGPMHVTAFDVLAKVDLGDHAAELLNRARASRDDALKDHDLAASIPEGDEAVELVRDALAHRARSHATVALSAIALIDRDRDALRAAIDSLQVSDPGQLANALETFEASEHRTIARTLVPLWEASPKAPGSRGDWMESLADDPDPLVRACVDHLRRPHGRGAAMSHGPVSMSAIERVLALRNVPLFAELSPADLQKVAGITEERAYADGDVIASENELGDELHIVISGTVLVQRDQEGEPVTVAHRGSGEAVGEMSLITRAPRVASLIAEGDVRTLRIGHREFESMLRERPEVSLAVMRQLAQRLGDQTASASGEVR